MFFFHTARFALKTALHCISRFFGVGCVIISRHHPFTADEFRAYLRANSLSQSLSAVGKPQGMGRVERFNRSVKEQGLAGFELEVGESSQVALDEYRKYYNESRTHQALGYRTPFEVLQSLNFAGVQ
jgi:transposase InsO family protein